MGPMLRMALTALRPVSSSPPNSAPSRSARGVLELVPGPFGGPSMWGPEFDKYNEFGKWWKMEFESLDGYDTEFKLNPVYEQFTPLPAD